MPKSSSPGLCWVVLSQLPSISSRKSQICTIPDQIRQMLNYGIVLVIIQQIGHFPIRLVLFFRTRMKKNALGLVNMIYFHRNLIAMCTHLY